MKKFILIVFLFLTACGSSGSYPYGTPTPTPNPGEIALQMMQQQMAANATAQVVGLSFSATAQVVGVTATANQLIIEGQRTEQARVDAAATSEQHRQDAQATSEQHRQDVQATQARMDADTAATQAAAAAAQARIDAQSTSDSLATATFTVMTLTAIPPHATLTQIAVNNAIVVSTQEVERSELSLQQQRDTNVIQWLFPIIGAIFLFVGLALYFWNQSQVRVEKNEDGDIDVIIFKNQKAFKPALFARPMLDLVTNDMPLLTDANTQNEVTRREQAIRALAAMPVHPTGNGTNAFNDVFSTSQKREDAFEIIEGDTMPPVGLLDGEALKSLEHDWKEANHDK
jgi:hypothetical protein